MVKAALHHGSPAKEIDLLSLYDKLTDPEQCRYPLFYKQMTMLSGGGALTDSPATLARLNTDSSMATTRDGNQSPGRGGGGGRRTPGLYYRLFWENEARRVADEVAQRNRLKVQRGAARTQQHARRQQQQHARSSILLPAHSPAASEAFCSRSHSRSSHALRMQPAAIIDNLRGRAASHRTPQKGSKTSSRGGYTQMQPSPPPSPPEHGHELMRMLPPFPSPPASPPREPSPRPHRQAQDSCGGGGHGGGGGGASRPASARAAAAQREQRPNAARKGGVAVKANGAAKVSGLNGQPPPSSGSTGGSARGEDAMAAWRRQQAEQRRFYNEQQAVSHAVARALH